MEKKLTIAVEFEKAKGQQNHDEIIKLTAKVKDLEEKASKQGDVDDFDRFAY